MFFSAFFVADDYEEFENMVKSNARHGLAVWPKNLIRLVIILEMNMIILILFQMKN